MAAKVGYATPIKWRKGEYMNIKHFTAALALLFALAVNGAPALAHDDDHGDHDKYEHSEKHHDHDRDHEGDRRDEDHHAEKHHHDSDRHGDADSRSEKSKRSMPSWWPF